MKHGFLVGPAAAAFAIACIVTACSPTDAKATVTGPDMAAAKDSPGVAGVSTMPAAAPLPDDKTKSFVEKAALTDMFEIEAANMALTRSKSAPIKAFAQMMIDDHTATTKQLVPLAATAGVAPPIALDKDHLDKLDELTKAKDADFDKRYLDQQQAAHSDALGLMKDYAQNGKDTGIQAFAIKVSGKVEEHLQKAKSLDKSGADAKKG